MKYEELKTKHPKLVKDVLSEYRNVNVDCEWYEFIIENFTTEAEKIGFDIDPDNVSFSGFWNQGDGASFTGTVDMLDFLKSKKLLSKYSKAVNAMRNNKVDELVSIARTSNLYFHSNTCTTDDIQVYDYITPATEDELEEIHSLIEDKRVELCDSLFKKLEELYEYLTSDKAVEEFLITSDIDLEV